ncbi:MAG: response regulator [Phormidium sp.]
MKILLIEDDESTAMTLAKILTDQNYVVNTSNNGETGLDLVKTYEYDLILLDLLLPGLDGINFCRQLRSQGYQIPILILTAKDSSRDRVMGLEAGADDYVVKPFDLPELLARIRALLRRGREIAPVVLTWENLQLNLDNQEVRYQGELIHLTPKEYGLLELFLRNPSRIFSRSAILDHVWSLGEFPGEEAVRTQIMGLRQKLKTAGIINDVIETIYGFGYRLKPVSTKVESLPKLKGKSRKKKPSQPEELKLVKPEDSGLKAEVMAGLAQIWENLKDTFLADLVLFEQAIAQIRSGTFDSELKEQARMQAHRFIGSLGSFGMLKGSEISRNIVQLLDQETIEDTGYFCQLVEALRESISEHEISKQITTTPLSSKSSNNSVLSSNNTRKLVIIDDDPELINQITIEAQNKNLRLQIVRSFAAAIETITADIPNIILLNISLEKNEKNGLKFLFELTCNYPVIPILVISERSQLSDRIAVARLGGKAFFQKPIATEQLFQSLSQIVQQNYREDAKVLIVDDDASMLGNLSLLLSPWGLQVKTLADPKKFWEVLEESTPDLLILDIEMPGFSGLDLCQAVRNDPRWSELPILFLSAHQDTETVRQVFAAGGDDYASKPILEPELIARVLNRLERFHHGKLKRLSFKF